MGNTINANGGDGIKLQTSAEQAVATLIETNVITNNNLNGVWVDGPNNSSILQNTISGNMNDGVEVTEGRGTRSSTNSIFNNANLAIELTSNGNNNEASPVITSTTLSGSGMLIVGKLNSTPSTSFTVQFFSSTTADPSGLGQGQTYLGEATVQTGARRQRNVQRDREPSPPAARLSSQPRRRTRTATPRNSRRYSPPRLVVTNTNDSGRGSLRQAILNANTLTGLQNITFAIDSTGVQTIRPLTPLPTITTPSRSTGRASRDMRERRSS